MKSRLLARQLVEIFGGEGEPQLRRLLASDNGAHPDLIAGVERLLAAADTTYAQYASLQRAQIEISRDTYSDWNFKSGQVESGRQWKTALGYSDAEIDNSLLAWQRLVHPEDLPRLQAAIGAHARGEHSVFSVDCRMRTSDGVWKWLLLKGLVTARERDGNPLRMLVLQRDISADKNTEMAMLAAKDAAESASKARGVFLANMSHEIRTPLNGIIGMTELALDTNLDPEQRHYLKTVKSSAESLLHVVNEILDFSKIEAGKVQFESIAFSLVDVVFDSIRVLATAAHKKGLEIIVDIAPDVPTRTIGDPTRLRQVITNLFGNAIKFTETGEIALEVRLESIENDTATLQFVVRDTGIGIQADKQQAIFEAFAQADVSTTRRFGGTGLGLAICQRLVHLMDGRIWLESVENQGAAFHFSARFGIEPAARKTAPPVVLAGKRALVVDDSPAVCRQLVAFLDHLGIHPTAAGDGPAAVAAIERARAMDFPYDFILLDAAMPAPGGFALVEAWHSGPQRERLLALVTTENQRQDLARLRELQLSAYLIKPIGRQELVDALLLAGGWGISGPETVDFADFDLDGFAANEKGLEILLVEDNPVNQELAVKLLERRGHQVTIANNGAEAVDWFEKRNFNAIFMDLQMPVMGGIEAAEAIRAREMRRSWVMTDGFASAYIIAMTANAMEGDRDRCLKAGMNDFISKPLRPADLDAALARLAGEAEEAASMMSTVFMPEQASVIDLAAALRNLGDRELLMNMANMMLSEWNDNIGRIRVALETMQAADLRMHAHTLKSLLSIFHAEKARQAALELEKAAQIGDEVPWVQCRELFVMLTDELIRVKPEIERFARGEATV
ncbi:MAG: response regulator [Betaproteobacteria bacterium]